MVLRRRVVPPSSPSPPFTASLAAVCTRFYLSLILFSMFNLAKKDSMVVMACWVNVVVVLFVGGLL